MNDMDKVLKEVLSPKESPPQKLNEIVLNQMRMKECKAMGLKHRRLITAAAVGICLLIVPGSVYAAYQYLRPQEAAKEMSDEKLGQAFGKDGSEVLQTIVDGPYKVTYLGHVTGESISDRTGSAWELHPDRIYVAVAVENADGTAMQSEVGHNLFVSPLIQGLAPWSYNIVTMNGSYMEQVIDGVLYRIIECDNIEVFADKKLYLAVSDTAFFSNNAYQYDETTGEITAKEEYEGTNALFDLVLDPSKADPVKAKEYLDQLEKEWNSDSITDDQESKLQEEGKNDIITNENPRVQQELFLDEENDITIRVKDNDSHRWQAGEAYSQTILSYYLQVEGDNIDTITYTLNQGEFCSKPEHSIRKAEYYGKECSLAYEEQKDRDYLYSISFKGSYEDYGYDVDELSKLGATDIDARDRIYYEVLEKAISDTKMSMEIKMKDGSSIVKTISFCNVLDDQVGSFWIALELDK